MFHGLRANYFREHKKYKDFNLPRKTWKFCESMLFLSGTGPMQKAVFTTEEREILITFYEANPALWNHGMVEYRDRNLRRALLQKLLLEFDQKFSVEEIKSGILFQHTINEKNKMSSYQSRQEQVQTRFLIELGAFSPNGIS